MWYTKRMSFRSDQNKEPKKVSDIFFDQNKKMASLRDHPFFRLELDPVRARALLKHLEPFVGFLILIVLVVVLWISPYSTHATVATFYPSSCLGGWEGVGNTAGQPSLSLDEARIEDFTKDNSAYTAGSGELYCGNFAGEVPEGSTPKKFTLTLSWSVDLHTVVHNDPVPVTVDNTVPVEDSPSVEVEEVESSAETMDTSSAVIPNTDVEVIEVPDTAPAPLPEEAPAQEDAVPNIDVQSFLNLFAPKKVFAQEASENEVPAETAEVEVAENLEDREAVVEAPVLEEAPVEGFMEVLYTLDANDWHVLGVITMNNWRNASFDIPLTEWTDLSKLQISFRPKMNIDPFPAVYLDAMILSVEYDTPEVEEVSENDMLTITEIVNKDDRLTISAKGGVLNPEQIVIETVLSELGNIAIYNTDTGRLVLTTWTDQPQYVADPSYLGVGQYLVITTRDPDGCNDRTFDACLQSTELISSASFSVSRKKSIQMVPIVDVSNEGSNLTIEQILFGDQPAEESEATTMTEESDAVEKENTEISPPQADTSVEDQEKDETPVDTQESIPGVTAEPIVETPPSF